MSQVQNTKKRVGFKEVLHLTLRLAMSPVRLVEGQKHAVAQTYNPCSYFWVPSQRGTHSFNLSGPISPSEFAVNDAKRGFWLCLMQ